MKAVDFVVELADRYLFIEVKDPQRTEAAEARRDEFIRRCQSGKLDHDLKYKTGKWAAALTSQPAWTRVRQKE